MPPPTMTTSNCFIDLELFEFPLGCVNTQEHSTIATCRHSQTGVEDQLLTFALFLELQHRRAGGDFDLAVDDGALGDGDGSGGDLAADHRGIADFQFVPDVETSRDL